MIYVPNSDTINTNKQNVFIPMTSRDENSVPASIFPAIYDLQSLNGLINRSMQGFPWTTGVESFW